MSDTLLPVSFSRALPPIDARVRVPAVPDTTFEVVDSSSGLTFNVRLSDSAIDVQASRAPDTVTVDTVLSVPRLKVEIPADKVARRKQIIFAVCFCFACITIWFGATVILKFIK